MGFAAPDRSGPRRAGAMEGPFLFYFAPTASIGADSGTTKAQLNDSVRRIQPTITRQNKRLGLWHDDCFDLIELNERLTRY